METERQYLLEKAGKVAIVQLCADGLKELSLEDKILAYHLYEATAAGRDITCDQNHRQGLAVRNILQQILAYSQRISQAIMKQRLKYSGKI
jgi:dipeptidyl-peptidase-3